MELHPIKTETDYQEALRTIESLFDAAPNTPECDRLDILSTLVEAYEKAHFPIAIPDPIAAIQYYMDTRGWSRLGETVRYLYSEWLPLCGKELRDFPLYFQRVSLFPDVPEFEAITDVFLPLQ